MVDSEEKQGAQEAQEAQKQQAKPWKRRVRIVLMILAACIVVGAIAFGITNAVVMARASEAIVTAEEAADYDADAILVLGAQVNPDGNPSWVLQDRLDNGIALYKAGAAPKIIMSGDHGTVDYDEVRAMKDYAIAAGVPADDIFCDHAGFSTYESMWRAKNVFGAARIVISTQNYHLYRSLYDALGLGIEAVGVPADNRTFPQQIIWDIREIPARSKDLVKVLVQAPPTFGGDPIDLNGPGSVTDD